MKGVQIVDLRTLDLKEALFDETIFVLHDHRQAQIGYEDVGGELRCSCRPIKGMTAKALREMLENIDDYKAIKLEL